MEKIADQLGYEGNFGVERETCCSSYSYSNNHIDLVTELEESRNWRFTGLYGDPTRNLGHNSTTHGLC